MPRLTVGAELQRILAESREDTRYRDIAIRVRRLTVDKEAREGDYVDAEGRAWVAGDVAPDGRRRVWSKQRGASTTARDGLELRAEDGATARLRVDVVVEAGGVWDAQRKAFKLSPDGQRVKAERLVVVDLTPAHEPPAAVRAPLHDGTPKSCVGDLLEIVSIDVVALEPADAAPHEAAHAQKKGGGRGVSGVAVERPHAEHLGLERHLGAGHDERPAAGCASACAPSRSCRARATHDSEACLRIATYSEATAGLSTSTSSSTSDR